MHQAPNLIMGMFRYFQVVVLVFAIIRVEGADEECNRVTTCSKYGPEIRFPFWLKDHQPEHCGYPGFQLSCHHESEQYRGYPIMVFKFLANTSLPGIYLLVSATGYVGWIDYKSQVIAFADFNIDNATMVSPSTFSTSLSTAVPFQSGFTSSQHESGSVFFSCSRKIEYSLTLTDLSGQAFEVIYVRDDINLPFLTSCTKVLHSSLNYDYLDINWLTPNCGKCEAKGEYCKQVKNTTTSNIQTDDQSTTCFPIPQKKSAGRSHVSIKPIQGKISGAIFSVLVLLVLLYYNIRLYKQKKYNKLKIEMFLEDYKAMKPTRYSYADIKKITRHFKDRLGQGGYGSVYKGQITNEFTVAVKVLNSDPKANGEDFINEVSTIGQIHHVNVVRLVGYCADGCNRALVYEFQPNKSLEKFTYTGKSDLYHFLGWEKMQKISLGIAKGIEYLHQGCAQQILHFDIKPHNILLDQNFNPKISDFGLAKLCAKDQSMVTMTMARGTIGYIAPEVYSRNFGKVSAKSDVYSFGMLLLEMVGARDNNAEENTSETYFPEWIFHRLEEGGEVAIEIEKEEDSNIARKLTIVGLWCIGWHPVDRPSMKHVIQMLERQECPAMPPNPFSSSNVRPLINELEVISESE